MWWKLSVLVVVTAVLVLATLPPPRTHLVRIDPMNPPPRPSVWQAIGSAHLTPTSGLLIAVILAAAILIGVKIVRGS